MTLHPETDQYPRVISTQYCNNQVTDGPTNTTRSTCNRRTACRATADRAYPAQAPPTRARASACVPPCCPHGLPTMSGPGTSTRLRSDGLAYPFPFGCAYHDTASPCGSVPCALRARRPHRLITARVRAAGVLHCRPKACTRSARQKPPSLALGTRSDWLSNCFRSPVTCQSLASRSQVTGR